MSKILFEQFESERLQETYDRYRHPSGLDIYIFPKKMTTTYAMFATRFGSVDRDFRLADDPNAETVHVPAGVAHFLEHKMFSNEDGVDSFERFSAYGADANAYTAHNRTVYLFGCTENFSESLTELLRFVTHPYFTEESVEKEQGIIAQEIKMYDDDPYERCFTELLRCLYHSHPVRENICGTVKSIRRITPQILMDCYRVFYNLSNMALVICGDVDVNEVLAIADRELPHEQPVQILRSLPHEPDAICKARFSRAMQVSKPIFNIGFKDTGHRLPPMERQRREAAMSILNEMLFSRSGELFNSLFESGKISPGFSYGYSMSDTFSFNSLAGEADDPEIVLNAVLDYIVQKKKTGLDPTTFARCKRVMCAEYIKDFDSTEEIASDLLGYIFDDGEMFTYGDLLRQVALEDTERLLHEVFDEKSVCMAVITPSENKTIESEE
jgi:predicted Zn-dependent peptidase